MQKNIYDEIIDNQIVNLDRKNPQYQKEYFLLYWEKFWNLFEKTFSKWFEFDEPNNFSNRVIYLEAKNKKDMTKTLFVLSLPEGHMKSIKGKLLVRLRFKNEVLKKCIKENLSIFYVSFYAPLINKNINSEEIFYNTDFEKSVLIVSTLQEIWNSSKKYGERYNSILYNRPFTKEEWISVIIEYNKILSLLRTQNSDLKFNIIELENNKLINKNKEGLKKNKKENVSYNLIKVNHIESCIDELVKKNYDFMKWVSDYQTSYG